MDLALTMDGECSVTHRNAHIWPENPGLSPIEVHVCCCHCCAPRNHGSSASLRGESDLPQRSIVRRTERICGSPDCRKGRGEHNISCDEAQQRSGARSEGIWGELVQSGSGFGRFAIGPDHCPASAVVSRSCCSAGDVCSTVPIRAFGRFGRRHSWCCGRPLRLRGYDLSQTLASDVSGRGGEEGWIERQGYSPWRS